VVGSLVDANAPKERERVDLVLSGGWVITVDAGRRIFRHGAVAVSGTSIVAVDDVAGIAQRYQGDTTIDTTDMVVMPGLINGHRHLLTTPKGAQPDGNVTLINLRDFVYPAFASLSEEEMHAYTLHATAEMIRFGTTAFEEPGCIHLPAVLEALDTSGIRCRVGPWTWDQVGVVGANCPDWLRMTSDNAIRRLQEGLETVQDFRHDLIDDAVTIEGVGTCSDELTVAAANLAKEADSLFVLHKATSEQEVTLELEAFGHRPVEHMFRIGALNEHVFMNHVTSLDLFEVAMIAESGAGVGQNPSTALKLSKGTTQTGKWPELLAAGVPMALGTDAENASNHQDLCRSMYLAALLPRDARRDPQAVTAEQAVEMATIGGATALRLSEKVGSLEKGKQADITVFSTQDFDWRPLHNPISSLVYGATGYSVDTVIVAGNIVLRSGQHTRIDLGEVRERVEAIDRDVLRRLGVSPIPAWPIVDDSDRS
jgi:cytosine/adenosine deaminase-related metal-dependent hydrolase